MDNNTFIENFRNNFQDALLNVKDSDPLRLTNAIAYALRDTNQTNEDYAIKNTFATDDNGISYGTGLDGNTYAYVKVGNNIEEFKPLTAEEQRSAIRRITGGRINVDPIITNQKSLNNIFSSISRMYNKGGNLVPGNVDIKSMYEDNAYGLWGPSGIAYNNLGESPDEVLLNGLAFPDWLTDDLIDAAASGWTSSSNKPGEYVPTHELSHTAEYGINRPRMRWEENKRKEAAENENRYPAGELFKQAFLGLFGKDYEPKSVEQEIYKELNEKSKKWDDENLDKYSTFGANIGTMLSLAAKNTGFDSVNDAAASISGYAGKTYPRDFTIYGENYHYDDVDGREVFAEAYTDVLFDGEDAAPFSKEIIRLYSEYADKEAERTGAAADKRIQEMRKLFSILPDFQNNNPKPRLKTYQPNFIDFSKNK